MAWGSWSGKGAASLGSRLLTFQQRTGVQGLLIDQGQAAVGGGLGFELAEAVGLGLGVLGIFGAHPLDAFGARTALTPAGGSGGGAAHLGFRLAVQFGRLGKVTHGDGGHLPVQQAAVVHAGGQACTFQVPVDGHGHFCAHFLNGTGFAVVQFTGFRAQPAGLHPPGGGEDVHVVVALVRLLVRGMDGEHGRKAEPVHQMGGEVAGQVGALLIGQLVRERHQELPCHHAVLARLGRFGSVPELGRVLGPIGSVSRGQNARDHHTAFAGVVVPLACAQVGDVQARAIRRAGHGAGALASTDGFDFATVNGHTVPKLWQARQSPFTGASGGRGQRVHSARGVSGAKPLTAGKLEEFA